MNSEHRRKVGAILVGDDESRTPIGWLVGIELIIISVGFLLHLYSLLPHALLLLASFGFVLGPAIYAGWRAAGVGTGIVGAWIPLVWISTFPPLVGYLRGSNSPRYEHIRLTAAEFGNQHRELVNGIHYDLTVWLAVAVFLGLGSYFFGWFAHKVASQRAG